MQLSRTSTMRRLFSLAAALSQCRTISAVVVRGAPPANATSTNSSANTSGAALGAAPAKRARLDVGFAAFEKDVMGEVSRSIDAHLTSAGWDAALRTQLANGTAALLHGALAVELKPMKQSIAKTWMALPEEKQKDDYVEQLRSSFSSMFTSTLDRVGSHANVSLGRLVTAEKAKKLDRAELLKRGLTALNSSLLADHCYDEAKSLKKKTGAAPAKVAQTNAGKPSKTAATTKVTVQEPAKPVIAALQEEQAAADPQGQFCVKSLLHGFVHRLDDSQMLVSMTMRFDARAMAMVQWTKVQVA